MKINIENFLVVGFRNGQSEFLDPALKPLDGVRKKWKSDAFGGSMAVYKIQELWNLYYYQVR